MGDENGEDSSVMRIGKRCYVGNLAWKTSWQDLKDKFRDVGNVVYANVMRDDGGMRGCWRIECCSLAGATADQLIIFCSSAGRSKGWGIVEFETPEEVGSLCLLSVLERSQLALILRTYGQARGLNTLHLAGSHCCEHLQWY